MANGGSKTPEKMKKSLQKRLNWIEKNRMNGMANTHTHTQSERDKITTEKLITVKCALNAMKKIL